ncbi:hypothetical protein QFZ31_002334 [Neobacillus niacini]|jgi:putative aldouronate transport system permease protein|nr:hypothetical protein [Neobacillus niacini]MDQ0972456.1 hypothetical protein [Neobacillus niacini]
MSGVTVKKVEAGVQAVPARKVKSKLIKFKMSLPLLIMMLPD